MGEYFYYLVVDVIVSRMNNRKRFPAKAAFVMSISVFECCEVIGILKTFQEG
jgi:hypothetical protein